MIRRCFPTLPDFLRFDFNILLAAALLLLRQTALNDNKQEVEKDFRKGYFMSVKLEKIAAEREKARRKRDEWDARMKEWDQKYREQENEEIHSMVHAANLTPEMLAQVLASLQHGAPDMTKPLVSAANAKEENDDEND
jgi:hypothetical protein